VNHPFHPSFHLPTGEEFGLPLPLFISLKLSPTKRTPPSSDLHAPPLFLFPLSRFAQLWQPPPCTCFGPVRKRPASRDLSRKAWRCLLSLSEVIYLPSLPRVASRTAPSKFSICFFTGKQGILNVVWSSALWQPRLPRDPGPSVSEPHTIPIPHRGKLRTYICLYPRIPWPR